MNSHSDAWPKKMPAGDYARRWYTSRSKQSIINSIQRGDLPGEQEKSGQWFVWVNEDGSAAHTFNDSAVSNILNKFKLA